MAGEEGDRTRLVGLAGLAVDIERPALKRLPQADSDASEQQIQPRFEHRFDDEYLYECRRSCS